MTGRKTGGTSFEVASPDDPATEASEYRRADLAVTIIGHPTCRPAAVGKWSLAAEADQWEWYRGQNRLLKPG